MIKILQVNKFFYPWFGGVETVVTQLVEHLSKDSDNKVGVIAGNEKINSSKSFYKWNGADVYKTGSCAIKFSTPISFTYPFVLKKLINEYDVFHFHVPNPLAELSFFFLHFPPSKKVVVTVHADVGQTRWKFFSPVYNFFLKKMLKRADVITTMAPQNIESFDVLRKFKKKCVVVPLAFDETHICEVDETEKQSFYDKYGIDKQKKIVLFVGRLSYYKGINYLLEAVSNLKDVQLLIVGDGALKDESMLLAKKLNIADRVFFTGFLRGHDAACAFTISDVFVLPSITKSETFGIVQLEAMRFGLPVINTNLPTGVVSVGKDGETGYTIEPADTLALTKAIDKLLSDDKLRKEFSENAFQTALQFTPEIMVDKYKKIYLN